MIVVGVLVAVLLLVVRRRKARQRRAVAGLAETLTPHLTYTRAIPRGFFKGHGGSM